jgi:NADH dehydrogenase [ubiquinone] 1 alpha subcomplex assembly factor 1
MISRPAMAAFLFTCLPAAAGERQTVAEFSPEDSNKLDWGVVDDGVMGGLSQGNREISKDGILRFFGTLSLENNGGFSSLRTEAVAMDWSGAEGLMLRVKGDGRTYQLRLGTDAEYQGREMSFQASFPTEKDKWIEVKVPFQRMAGTWRGRDLPDKIFDPAKIRRLGLQLSDQKQGPFELRVDWIRTYGGDDSPPDLVAAAVADGRFGTLAKALGAAGLVETLQGKGPFTVFAPTDEAFKALPAGTVESLLKPENRDQLRAILALHALPGKVSAGDALNAGKGKSLGGGELRFRIQDGRFQVNGANILKTDIKADNGVIHVIDSVLLPEAKAGEAGAAREKKEDSPGPAGRIEAAISRGVPLFNSGGLP